MEGPMKLFIADLGDQVKMRSIRICGLWSDAITWPHEAAIRTCPTRERSTVPGRWRGDSTDQGLAGADQPVVWRCVLMPAAFSLQELHGVTPQIRTHFCRQAEDSVRH